MYLNTVLLLGMLFLHIVDDYYLQGFLASAKQKSWWEKNEPNKMYSKDYIIALCEHAFSWTFMIMLIPTIYGFFVEKDSYYSMYLCIFCLNWIVHCIVDNLKANKRMINLIIDQSFHILQVIFTWLILIVGGRVL